MIAAGFLFGPDEALPLKRAAQRVGKSTDTVRRWCEHGICRQAGASAPIEVSAVGLEMVVHGDFRALDLLKAGDREHPSVRRYLDHLGLAA